MTTFCDFKVLKFKSCQHENVCDYAKMFALGFFVLILASEVKSNSFITQIIIL